jgi:hypothetical protein
VAGTAFKVPIREYFEFPPFTAARRKGSRTGSANTAIFRSPRLATELAVLLVVKQIVHPETIFSVEHLTQCRQVIIKTLAHPIMPGAWGMNPRGKLDHRIAISIQRFRASVLIPIAGLFYVTSASQPHDSLLCLEIPERL